MDIEIALVAHLTQPESLGKMVRVGVRPEYFVSDDVRDMVQFSLDYYMQSGISTAPTREILRDEYPRWFSRHEEDIPDEDILLDYILDRLGDRYKRNRLQDTLTKAGRQSVEDVDEALRLGLDEIARIRFETTSKERVEPFDAKFEQRVSEYFDRVLAPGEEFAAGRGIMLGWPEVTDWIWGIKKREFGVLVAPPATGKSWALCKCALAAAMDGTRTYFASLENSREMTLMRLDCVLTGVPWAAYERGKLDMTQKELLKKGREIIEDAQMRGLLVVDSPTHASERTVFELYARARQEQCEFMVGDQLSWLTARDNYRGDRSVQMVEITTDISSYSKEFDMASLWAAQFNREGASQRGGGRLHQIGLSSNIEQIVDFAFSIHSNEEQRASEYMVFEILKGRRVELKSWLLSWRLQRETTLEVLREFRDE